ncbi:hypothetical protein V461_09050 [Pantoea ananatis BRT98]|nr:hypothetical protein V461_09050 [Pantoea ananatis BRT98]
MACAGKTDRKGIVKRKEETARKVIVKRRDRPQ